MTAAAAAAGSEDDERDRRAATEYLATVQVVGPMYRVYSEAGDEYTVDVGLTACTCADMEYRNPPNGCKHIRRVEMEQGQRAIPAGVTPERMLEKARRSDGR